MGLNEGSYKVHNIILAYALSYLGFEYEEIIEGSAMPHIVYLFKNTEELQETLYKMKIEKGNDND